ncbi:MAG: hypothetical protein JEZ12_07660 [Desulfobacterium sp.]|nr:hypothetical protein [Desulfobacterium sp.]
MPSRHTLWEDKIEECIFASLLKTPVVGASSDLAESHAMQLCINANGLGGF